jgi:hypothetical protein
MLHDEYFLRTERHGGDLDRAIFTRETGKGRGVDLKNRRFGLGRLVRSPFKKRDQRAYITVVNSLPARTLYFSRETRKEKGRKG